MIDLQDDSDFDHTFDTGTEDVVSGPADPADHSQTKDKVDGTAAEPDLIKAEADYWDTKQIPKNDANKARFLRLYPRGYPDDSEFKHMSHYHASSRSVSGYKLVGACNQMRRSEKWRLKFPKTGNTASRYWKKSKACEVAYWMIKKSKTCDDFRKRDTVPEAMFE